jgi:signal transduction histidine kinase
MIDPKNLKTNPYIPPVHIEEFHVDDQPVNVEPKQAILKIPPGDGKLEFHYAGLSFVAPEKVQFRYKLEGFDRQWISAGTRRTAYYTNIPPGHYQFQVTACNNDGVWNPNASELGFYLTPFFYQTFWFYGLCVLSGALLAWTVYKLRLRHLNARFLAILGERSRIARELHDTLAAGLAGIVMQLEAAEDVLLDAPEESRDHLSRARDVAKASLAEARRTVWAMRPQSLESADLPTALSQTARQQVSGSKTKLQFNVSGTPRPLSQQVESNFLRICQEAVTNALTHARPEDIKIHLQYDPHHVTLKIADDGEGFDTAHPVQDDGVHLGLLGMRERADQIGGRLTVESAPGSGTRIIVSAPSD